MKIKKASARKILNSAGNWTIESTLELENGKKASASVPQGISTGKGEKTTVNIETAINQIEKEISPELKEKDLNQERLDQILERGNWGSNATLAVSAAFFKLGVEKALNGAKMPPLMMIIFEGKKHGNPNLTTQEFMVVADKIEDGVNFYHKVKQHLEREKIITTVGSEGGFSPANFTDQKILDLLKKLGAEKIALDIAGNTNPPSVNSLLDIVRRYPVISLEDPLPESNRQEWRRFYQQAKEINPEILIVADDLTVTDKDKIKKGAEEKLFNAVIIKPNQQGTITAAAEALEAAKSLGIKTIVSHRGEETNDNWIVDFALKHKADFVKFGAPCRGERVAKYNRLLQLAGN